MLLLILAAAGCKKNKIDEEIDLGYDYFPNRVGTYIEYEVDSIHYGVEIDTVHFYLREELVNEFVDQQNQLAVRVHRYKKFNMADDWELKDVWVQKKTPTAVERVEENIRYVRMVFPINTDQRWDGNAYNTDNEWEHRYVNIDKSLSMSGFTFSKTLTVRQRNSINLIDQEKASEVYAKNVGLISKSFLDLTFQNLILIGNDVEWTLIDFGDI